MNKKLLLLIASIAISISFVDICYAQDYERKQVSFPVIGVKTNLLYDVTGTFNLGAEFGLNDKTSLDLPLNWNPFTYSNNRKWSHFLIQPEYRYWPKGIFSGHFFGLHGHYAFYNIGNLPPFLFSQNMQNNRYQGWLAGAGIGYGYRWNFNSCWSMEATVGVGYAYMDYSKYPCVKCGEKLGDGTRHYFGPTKAGISLIYIIGGKRKNTTRLSKTTIGNE